MIEPSWITASWFLAGLVYILPSLIAVGGQRRHAGLIVFVSLATSWTIIGWFGTLIWAVVASRRRLPANRFASVVDAACDTCGTHSRVLIGTVKACPNCRTGFIRAGGPILQENLDDLREKGDGY